MEVPPVIIHLTIHFGVNPFQETPIHVRARARRSVASLEAKVLNGL